MNNSTATNTLATSNGFNIGDYRITTGTDGTAYISAYDSCTISSIIDEAINSANNGTKKEKEVREDTKTKIVIKNNKIYVRYYENGFYKSEKQIIPDFKDLKIYNNTVVMFFTDGTKTSAVLDAEDVFNIEQGISTCITKRLLGEDGSAIYNKLIKRALGVKKQNEDKAYEEERKKQEIADKKEKYRLKKQKRNERKLKEQREAQIETMKEAYVRAFKEVHNGY